MSVWIWRLWIIGWSRCGRKYIVDMGETQWVGWQRLVGHLYIHMSSPTRHMGEYWEHPSLDWYRQWLREADKGRKEDGE